MYEIAVMNPRNAKGRFIKRKRNARRSKKPRHKAKHRRSNPSMKRNSKGRFVKGSRRSNPRRAKRRNKIRVRRTAHKVVISNPRRRRRNPRHHHRVHRHRRSNPISLGGLTSGLVPGLIDGAIGGAGALANSILLGYVAPMLPSTFTTGYAYDAVRIASAAILGMAGKKFGGRKGEIAGQGAMAVAMYFLLRDITTAMVPTLPLGDYEEISIDSTADQLGAYMDPARPLGAYLPDGSRAGGGGFSAIGNKRNVTPGFGAYMNGAGPGAGVNYEGEQDGFVLAGTDY
jgi:hypothetical protein